MCSHSKSRAEGIFVDPVVRQLDVLEDLMDLLRAREPLGLPGHPHVLAL